jgi:hypothetical protein
MIARRLLTQHVMDVLEATTHPIGLALNPPGSGWQGQPSAAGSEFIPYGVVVPGPASISEGPLTEPQVDWRLTYVITSYSVDPRACEWMADAFRQAMAGMQRSVVDLETEYRIQQVWVNALGAVTRYELTEPPYFGQTDSFTIWLSRLSPR